MTAFEEFGVLSELAKAIEEMDWTLPTDVQAEAIPLILGGGDVLMAAETGSGKTGAFCLPILQIVWETLKDIQEGKCSKVVQQISNEWTMSFFDRTDALAVTPDGLRCQSRDQQAWHGCRATKGVHSKGAYYYEATVTDEGLCRVGWSTQQAKLDLGTCRNGFGFGGTGKKSNNKQFDDYGGAFGKNDVVGCLLNLNSGEIKYTKNGEELGVAFRLEPPRRADCYFPAVVLKNAEMSFNFGATPFKYSPPNGYVALCQAPKDNVKQNLVQAGAADSTPVNNAPQAIIIEPSRELAEQTLNQITKFKKHLENPAVRELLVVGGINIKEQIARLNAGVDIVVGTTGRLEDLIQGDVSDARIYSSSMEMCGATLLHHIIKKHLKNPAVRKLLVVGGINIKEQIARLNAGVDIVVGTTGRLEDLIQGGYLALTHCRFFVLDEADMLLKQGCGDMIERLHRAIPKITADGRRLQMVVCSATLHSFEVKKMAEKLMHFPTWVDLKGEDAVPETVHHVVVIADPQKDRSWETLRNHVQTDGVHAKDNIRSGNTTPETLSEAVKLLKGEYVVRAIREHKMTQDRCIIFCRTKLDCDNLERYFRTFGSEFSCVCLHGDRKPNERKANLERFKQAQVKFLICTDVAARGLDITGLPFIINVTLPDEKSNYVHRIGRVGRAERMGLAISIVSSVPEKVWYHGEWCSSRGRNCFNTSLKDDRPRGCCMWYNEPQYLADIEDHLNITIQQVGADMKVPCNEFDGKVVYGEKRKQTGSQYQDHVTQMAPVVRSLQDLESQAQLYYLKHYHNVAVA